MRIQYIKHSGFLVECQDAIFVFDYYEGNLDLPTTGKQIYMFSSHKHSDHYHPRIFEFAKTHENITYVLSNDIKMSEAYMDRLGIDVRARECMIFVKKRDKRMLTPNLIVETLTSTDEGVAFVVTYEEKGQDPITMYHAGDLHWWTWIGESEEEYNSMTKRFQKEMEQLKNRTIQYAFVPLDPRQEERFWWGFDYVMRTAKIEHVFPMHCWEDYSVIPKLKDMEQSKPYRDRIQEIHRCDEWFEL